ncbi:hypothetical protein [Spiroplasma citri]|uniref:hypothetical protein n=1 Tax=Spiroplasma citri TaxID=2133 RepID=UPI0011BBC93E|nr:hypothetical protein [Spiroplasma citri]QED24296.1 hypothetical protein FRX96_02080 [Spiroplasma citri]
MDLNIEYLMKNKCNVVIVEGNTIRPCGKYSEDCIYDKNDKIWDYYCSEHYSKVKEDKINNEKSTENKEGCWCSKNECWCCRYRSELCCEDKKIYVIAKCDYCIKTIEKKILFV